MNVTVIAGTLSSAPALRTLASGTVLAQLQVTTRTPEEPARSVPVALADPPAWLERLEAGDEVVVLGAVQRRFFRAGGVTASRVEVSAERVARAGDRRARRRLVESAGARLAALGAD